MRRLIPLLCLAALLAFPGIPRAAEEPPEVRSLQSQIEELRQQLGEIEGLKARLAELEAQLQKTQAAQQKTEEARAKEARLHKITGYMQMRYRNDDAPDGGDEFLVRQVRLNVRGDVSPETGYRIELQADSKEKGGGGPGSKVQLRTAYIEHRFGGGRIRFGQTDLPWGYELQTGVPVLWTGERALFMDRLFPDQRDIGFEYEWSAGAKTSPVISVGLFNGAGINASDNNGLKDPVARIRFPFTHGSAALSYYDGRSDAGSSAKDGTRWGIGGQADWSRLSFMGEYVQGEDEGEDIRGWYAQLGTQVGKTPGFIFAKFDNYDENIHISGNEFNRLSLGYYYDLNPAARVTLVYECRNVDSGFSETDKWDGNAYYLQWQLKY
jgi:hypothetical protein